MITTCIFDAYGTLFDVTSAARAVANEEKHITFAKHWVKVAKYLAIKATTIYLASDNYEPIF